LADQTGANILKILRDKLDVGCFSALHWGFRNIHRCSQPCVVSLFTVLCQLAKLSLVLVHASGHSRNGMLH